jgi:energy-coupling factor transporter ATP-binding protein EcfA2
MIRHLRLTSEFTATPYLPGSRLMLNHPDGITFSTEKPNAVIGPNGAGKSALMTTLSLLTLTHFTGESAFNREYFCPWDANHFWARVGYSYENKYRYLHGLECDHDKAPGMYYRPNHVPGNEKCTTTAMMTGYGDMAREFGNLVRNKSSGEQCLALLAKVDSLLDGTADRLAYQYVKWGYGKDLIEIRNGSESDHKAEALKKLYSDVSDTAVPVLLLNEPEQSLDASAEVQFWQRIERSDPTKVQVIAETHSLYPIIHRDRFHLIEAVPGYADAVRAALGI